MKHETHHVHGKTYHYSNAQISKEQLQLSRERGVKRDIAAIDKNLTNEPRYINTGKSYVLNPFAGMPSSE
jgi:hypothetical protein